MGHVVKYEFTHTIKVVLLNVYRSFKHYSFTYQTPLCTLFFHRFLHPILQIPRRPQFFLRNRQFTAHSLSMRNLYR